MYRFYSSGAQNVLLEGPDLMKVISSFGAFLMGNAVSQSAPEPPKRCSGKMRSCDCEDHHV